MSRISIRRFPIAAALVMFALGSGQALGQFASTVIIDCRGDFSGDCINLTGNYLDNPRGIAVDAAGNVYVAGQNSDNAFVITPYDSAFGVIDEIIDATGDGAGNGLDKPISIAVDAAGNAYVAGIISDNAFKITPAGVVTQIIDCTGDGTGNCTNFTGNDLDGPNSIAVDALGNVYVAAEFSDNAFKISSNGVITEIIDATGDGAGNALDGTQGIAVDAAGNVYVTGWNSDNAFKITPAGVITEIIDSSGDGAGNGLDQPIGIAVDAAGNVYLAGQLSHNAFKITPAGAITEIIDSSGDGAGNGLDQPFGVTVDASGNVYVTGFISDNAFRITPAGIITEIIDSSGDGFGNDLDGPIGIAVDAFGEVYVTGFNSDNAFRTFPCKYQIDSGDDNLSFSNQSGIAEWAWIQNFEAEETCTCITAVETKLFGLSSLPKDVTVYIWSDPTPDLDPSDAVLISQSLPTSVDSWDLVTIDLATPVEVASVPEQFWAGAMTIQDDTVFGEPDASAPYDTTVPSNNRAWLAQGFPFTPEDLSNGRALEPVGDLGLPDGVWVIRPIAEPGPCPPVMPGACCLPDTPCVDGETGFSCILLDGAYQGDGTLCAALPDHDGDGVLDDCDPDIDDDGVLNAADECDFTPTGINVDATGHPLGDIDRDCDVDLIDFALMQENFTGPLSP